MSWYDIIKQVLEPNPKRRKLLMILLHYGPSRAKDLEKTFGSKSVYYHLKHLLSKGFVRKDRVRRLASYYGLTADGNKAAKLIRSLESMQLSEGLLHKELKQLAFETGVTESKKVELREAKLEVYSKIIAGAIQLMAHPSFKELNESLKNPRDELLSLIKSFKENESKKRRLIDAVPQVLLHYRRELDKLNCREVVNWFIELVDAVCDRMMAIIHPLWMIFLFLIVPLMLSLLCRCIP